MKPEAEEREQAVKDGSAPAWKHGSRCNRVTHSSAVAAVLRARTLLSILLNEDGSYTELAEDVLESADAKRRRIRQCG